MSAEGPQPGEITLHGVLILANRRAVPGKPNSFVFDAIFPCSAETRDCIGSFRHYIGAEQDQKLDDIYEVRAKVCIVKGLL